MSLTIQNLGLGATGQKGHFGATFRFDNHVVRKQAYFVGKMSGLPPRQSQEIRFTLTPD